MEWPQVRERIETGEGRSVFVMTEEQVIPAAGADDIDREVFRSFLRYYEAVDHAQIAAAIAARCVDRASIAAKFQGPLRLATSSAS